jgi:hypothetical protein
MDSQKCPGMEVLHCNGRTYSNAYQITFKVVPLRAHTQTYSMNPATVGSSGRRILLKCFGIRPSHSIWCPPCLRHMSPRGPFAEQGTAKSHSKRDPESAMVGWWQGRDCCTTSDVWFGALPWRRNRWLCHWSRRYSELHRVTSAELGRRNDQ